MSFYLILRICFELVCLRNICNYIQLVLDPGITCHLNEVIGVFNCYTKVSFFLYFSNSAILVRLSSLQFPLSKSISSSTSIRRFSLEEKYFVFGLTDHQSPYSWHLQQIIHKSSIELIVGSLVFLYHYLSFHKLTYKHIGKLLLIRGQPLHIPTVFFQQVIL